MAIRVIHVIRDAKLSEVRVQYMYVLLEVCTHSNTNQFCGGIYRLSWYRLGVEVYKHENTNSITDSLCEIDIVPSRTL